MIDALARAKVLFGDRRRLIPAALTNRKIAACIPSKRLQKPPIPHDAAFYPQRHTIEIMFGMLKDW